MYWLVSVAVLRLQDPPARRAMRPTYTPALLLPAGTTARTMSPLCTPPTTLLCSLDRVQRGSHRVFQCIIARVQDSISPVAESGLCRVFCSRCVRYNAISIRKRGDLMLKHWRALPAALCVLAGLL